MKSSRLTRTLVALIAIAALAGSAHAQANKPKMKGPFLLQNDAYDLMTEAQVEETEAYALGIQAYLWGMKVLSN